MNLQKLQHNNKNKIEHYMKKMKWIAGVIIFASSVCQAQQVTLTPDQIKAITPDWKGERFADGSPKVSDRLLERLKAVHLEEAWGILRNKGYQNQFEGDWMVEHP